MRTAFFLAFYCAAITAANVLLKLSADAGRLWAFLTFQAAGNLAGLAGILVYTWLMRSMPLHVAFPLSRGAGVLGVQLVGSILIFREAFTLKETVGAVAVTAGIILVGLSFRGEPPSLGPSVKASGSKDRGA